MKKVILFILVLFSNLFFWISESHGAYVISEDLIRNEKDALKKCPRTCNRTLTDWTGEWWITADPFAVCECFHGYIRDNDLHIFVHSQDYVP